MNIFHCEYHAYSLKQKLNYPFESSLNLLNPIILD